MFLHTYKSFSFALNCKWYFVIIRCYLVRLRHRSSVDRKARILGSSTFSIIILFMSPSLFIIFSLNFSAYWIQTQLTQPDMQHVVGTSKSPFSLSLDGFDPCKLTSSAVTIGLFVFAEFPLLSLETTTKSFCFTIRFSKIGASFVRLVISVIQLTFLFWSSLKWHSSSKRQTSSVNMIFCVGWKEFCHGDL